MSKSIETKGYFKKQPRKNAWGLLACAAITPVLEGCKEKTTQVATQTTSVSQENTKTDANKVSENTEETKKKITGSIQAVGSYVVGETRLYDLNNPEVICDKGQTNARGTWKYESDLDKCPIGTDLAVWVKGINSDTGEPQELKRDVEDETTKKVQTANEITTTIVNGLKKDTEGVFVSSTNSIERFAEVLGVKPEQIRRNYMEQEDHEFGEKLSAYTSFKQMLKISSGKSGKDVDKMIMRGIKNRKSAGQSIQLFKHKKAELFSSSGIFGESFGETTFLEELLEECLEQNSRLSFEGIEGNKEKEEWKSISKQMLGEILNMSFKAGSGASREKYKKTAIEALSLLKKTIENKQEGKTGIENIQVKTLQAWLSTQGVSNTAKVMQGQKIGVISDDIKEKMRRSQKEAENEENKKERILSLGKREIPSIDEVINSKAKFEIGFNDTEGGDLYINNIPTGIIVIIHNPKTNNSYEYYEGEKVEVSERQERITIEVTLTEEYTKRKQEQKKFGEMEEVIQAKLLSYNSYKGEAAEFSVGLKFKVWVEDIVARKKEEERLAKVAAEKAEAERKEAERIAEVARIAEEKRVAAEQARVKAEAERKEAERLEEVARVAEEKRVAAEQARIKAEAERIAAEKVRVKAEAERLAAEKLAEETRIAEIKRVAAEQARAKAEAERLAAEKLAEEARIAEAKRLAVEQARAKAEAERLAAEKLAEETRAAEVKRIAAEQARAKAEAERLAAEKLEEEARIAEAKRIVAEQARAKAEAERKEAERLAEVARIAEARKQKILNTPLLQIEKQKVEGGKIHSLKIPLTLFGETRDISQFRISAESNTPELISGASLSLSNENKEIELEYSSIANTSGEGIVTIYLEREIEEEGEIRIERFKETVHIEIEDAEKKKEKRAELETALVETLSIEALVKNYEKHGQEYRELEQGLRAEVTEILSQLEEVKKGYQTAYSNAGLEINNAEDTIRDLDKEDKIYKDEFEKYYYGDGRKEGARYYMNNEEAKLQEYDGDVEFLFYFQKQYDDYWALYGEDIAIWREKKRADGNLSSLGDQIAAVGFGQSREKFYVTSYGLYNIAINELRHAESQITNRNKWACDSHDSMPISSDISVYIEYLQSRTQSYRDQLKNVHAFKWSYMKEVADTVRGHISWLENYIQELQEKMHDDTYCSAEDAFLASQDIYTKESREFINKLNTFFVSLKDKQKYWQGIKNANVPPLTGQRSREASNKEGNIPGRKRYLRRYFGNHDIVISCDDGDELCQTKKDETTKVMEARRKTFSDSAEGAKKGYEKEKKDWEYYLAHVGEYSKRVGEIRTEKQDLESSIKEWEKEEQRNRIPMHDI
ncbi:hypothetical protein HON22_06130, partial [Candidatus Peregrinibacteria bacterium]|nr:hypothetical protein [Candidatus Peregrinibacteria bacterium]